MLTQVSYELKFIIEKILTNVEAERLHDRKSWVMHKVHYKIDSSSQDYTLSGSGCRPHEVSNLAKDCVSLILQTPINYKPLLEYLTTSI